MIKLGNFSVGSKNKPFVIAEMSGNHNQSLERALEIVEAAAKTGANALKIQTYTPDTMTINIDEREFHISDPDNLWTGRSLYELYGEAYTPWEWHKDIFQRSRELGIIPFSTPFDATAVDFLEELEVDFYKIASFENTDIPLIKKVAATGKPMIISTGMASIADIHETVSAANKAGCKDLILLKCTSTYPATPDNTNLLTIPHMRDLFHGCEIGLSDHTMGIGASIAGVALGATVIEKHFTLDRSDGGVDSTFSMEPSEMRSLVIESERAWQAKGKVSYGVDAEKNSFIFRRSLYITESMKKGDIFSSKNLRAIRPGLGLPPKYLDNFLGKKAGKDIDRGTALSWDLLT